MDTKHKGSDAGNSDMTERSHILLPINEKRNVLDLIRKEKNCMLRLLRFTIRTSLLSLKIVKKEKEICATTSVVALQTANVMATMHESA